MAGIVEVRIVYCCLCIVKHLNRNVSEVITGVQPNQIYATVRHCAAKRYSLVEGQLFMRHREKSCQVLRQR